MGHDREVSVLREAFRDYCAVPFPRSTGGLDLGTATIDMAEEDTYLAGLVDSFLHQGRLSIPAIVLDPRIDERLDAANEGGPEAPAVMSAYLSYRRKMRELAARLSEASGVPLQASSHLKD